jgi:phosphoribosyl 1,2-cyclic phosphodiesterase
VSTPEQVTGFRSPRVLDRVEAGDARGFDCLGPSPEPASLRVVCWGTRGSISSPGPETVAFGGNTACVEVRTSTGRSIILDGGTGIRRLGAELTRREGPLEVELFLTHFHWDHIQGIPFFAPIHDPRARICVHAPPETGRSVEELFAGQMSRTYFPLPYEALAGSLHFFPVGTGVWALDELAISAFRVCHPGYTVGYEIEFRGLRVVYIPDNELAGDGSSFDDEWYARLVEFVAGADLLIHDAMYTEAEYERRRGWGHSTAAQAVALAASAGVKRLLLFHHDPDRTDEEIQAIVCAAGRELVGSGIELEVEGAAEGRELVVLAPDPA